MSKKCEKDHIVIENNTVDEGSNRYGIIMVEDMSSVCTDPNCPTLKGNAMGKRDRDGPCAGGHQWDMELMACCDCGVRSEIREVE